MSKHKSTVAAFAAAAVLFTGGALAAGPAHADPPPAAEKCPVLFGGTCHVYAHATDHGVYTAKVKPPKDAKQFSVTGQKDADGDFLNDAKEVYRDFVKQTMDTWEKDKKIASTAGLEPLPNGPDGPNSYYSWINKRAVAIDTKNPPKAEDGSAQTATIESGDASGGTPTQQNNDPQANPQGSSDARKQAWNELRALHVVKSAESKDITTKKFHGKTAAEVIANWDGGLTAVLNRDDVYKAALDQAVAMDKAGLVIDSVSGPDIAKNSASTDPEGATKKANEEVALRQKEVDSNDYTFGVRNGTTYDYDIVDGKRVPQ